MKIDNNTVVSINYRLTDDQNVQIDSSADGEPLVYLHGSGELIDGLERELIGKVAGESFAVTIQPQDAYGDADPTLVRDMPIDDFGGMEMREGMQLQGKEPDGSFVMLRVMKISDGKVTVDMNHPLAGQVLKFEVDIAEVRAATSEELDHGHVHHGHEHH